MTSSEKNNLLFHLAGLKERIYRYNNNQASANAIVSIIDRNLTSIEKQIKKL